MGAVGGGPDGSRDCQAPGSGRKCPVAAPFSPRPPPVQLPLAVWGAAGARSGAGQGRCGGAPGSVGGGPCRAGTPPVTNPWPRCPPPAGFADGPERAGLLRGPRLCPRAQPRPPPLPGAAPPAAAAAPTRCASSREPRPWAGAEPGRPPSVGAEPEVRPPPGTLPTARPRRSPLSAPQKEREETGRDRPWQKFVNSGGHFKSRWNKTEKNKTPGRGRKKKKKETFQFTIIRF